MATTQIADVVVPQIFTPYTQQITKEKSKLIQAGVLVSDSELDSKLAGGGLTFNVPSFKDLLGSDVENVSTDDTSTSTPKKTGTSKEIAVRLSRNQSWSSMDLTADLAGADPMQSIANRVGYYWARRLQAAYVATVQGIFADNAAAPAGTEHVQNDMTLDISGASYSAGVTDFNASGFIDACVTMGDSMDDLTAIMVHSIVYARMLKNNLIDFIPDSQGNPTIPTYLGRTVIVDDGLPNPAGAGAATTASGIFHTWIMGAASVRLGTGQARTPTEVQRKPEQGNGAGEEVLYNRVEWAIHVNGHAYVGTSPNGGPSNATSSNNLANATSFQRVWPERKMIRIARLITRES